jgi:hypothetical protein
MDNPISPARSRRLRRANSAPVSLVALTRAEQRRYDRAPLMRFRPLQRLPVRDALVRSSHAPTDPASAFSQAPARPRVRGSGSSGARRPCGFPPCEHDAVKLDVRTLLVAGLAQFERAAVNAAAKRCIAMSATSSVVSAGADRCIRCPARSEATRHIKRHRFVRSPHATGHASRPTFARCSATGSSLRGLAGRADPSLISSGGAPGVQLPFAGLLPRQVAGHF